MKQRENGQTLVEILIGLAIGALIIGAATYTIFFSLSSGTINQQKQIATGLGQDFFSKVRSVTDANWLDLYNLSDKSSNSQYQIIASGTMLVFATGTQTEVVDGVTYTQFFSVEDVNRDVSDNISEDGNDDPSTQKVTAYARWSNDGVNQLEFKIVDYLTRWRNRVLRQSDWIGGAGEDGVLTEPNNRFATATTQINIQTPGVLKLSL